MVVYEILKSFGFILLLWNCRSILSNIEEFKKLIEENNPDVICLTETWLFVTSKFKLKNYKIYRNDRFGVNCIRRGGGVAVLIKETLNSRLYNNFPIYNDGLLENITVEVKLNKIWCKITTIYNPCRNIEENEFNHYFNNLGQNSIFAGDFNGHHSVWSNFSNVSNFTGKSLASSLTKNSTFNILTPKGTTTHFNKSRGMLKSTIDLVFGSGQFSLVDFVQVTHPVGSSDHFPVFYCFKRSSHIEFQSSPLSWNFNKINWEIWSLALERKFEKK